MFFNFKLCILFKSRKVIEKKFVFYTLTSKREVGGGKICKIHAFKKLNHTPLDRSFNSSFILINY